MCIFRVFEHHAAVAAARKMGMIKPPEKCFPTQTIITYSSEQDLYVYAFSEGIFLTHPLVVFQFLWKISLDEYNKYCLRVLCARYA
jgi:hypothetical protein